MAGVYSGALRTDLSAFQPGPTPKLCAPIECTPENPRMGPDPGLGAHRNREKSRMSLSLVHSRALLGLEARPVCVEVHLANGLPSFTMVRR